MVAFIPHLNKKEFPLPFLRPRAFPLRLVTDQTLLLRRMIFFQRSLLARSMTFKAGSVVRDSQVQGILGNPGRPCTGKEEEHSEDKQHKHNKYESIFHSDLLNGVHCTASLRHIVTDTFPLDKPHLPEMGSPHHPIKNAAAFPCRFLNSFHEQMPRYTP